MANARAAAVIRFSSLGDVLLAAHLPAFLQAADPARRVLFVTKERFGTILRGHPHVHRFFLLADGSSAPGDPAPFAVRGTMADLVAGLRREGAGELFDLHRNWRSAVIARGLGAARTIRAPKHALRRRLMVHARWLRPAPLAPLLERYRALAGTPPSTPASPWLRAALGERELDRSRAALTAAEREGGFALLAAGARWETKRWPARHFVALADALEREHGLPARFAIAPGEAALEAELGRLLPPGRRGALSVLEIRAAAALAAHARVIVSNDSAMLHLGPALGVPAVGVFGSTVPGFGFAPQGPRDRVAEIELPCRPCDVHGKRRCPLRHHACLETLEPGRVQAAVLSALDAEASPFAERGA